MTRARSAPFTGKLVHSAGAQLRIAVAVLSGAASLAAIALIAVPAHPQDVVPDQSLIHVELGPEKDTVAGAFVTGSVKNDSRYRIGDVRLRVEIRDPEGRLLDAVSGWVYGDVPPGETEPFRVLVPVHGDHVQVTIESFDRVSAEGP
jgi:hypothetical protein